LVPLHHSITAWNLALDELGKPNIGPFPFQAGSWKSKQGLPTPNEITGTKAEGADSHWHEP